MYKQPLYLVSLIILLIASCKTQNQKNSSIGKELSHKKSAKKYILSTNKSTIGWKGSRVIAGSHKGTIDIALGAIWVHKGNIQAGNFTMDMHTIKNTDIEDEKTKAQLVGHLSSPDFFDVDSYPETNFILTKVIKHTKPALKNNYTLSGNLTLKEVTKEITFPSKVSIQKNTLTANAKIEINRLHWNITWGTKNDNATRAMLKDKFISNVIELDINLVANTN